MSTNQLKTKGISLRAKRRMRRRAQALIAAGVVLVVAAVGAWTWRNWFFPPPQKDQGDIVEVMRGPLTIDVTQAGQIQNRDLVKVRSEVEGRTTIITLVEEGTQVKKHDLLVELDASGLKDSKEQQLLSVDKAEAAYIGAREDLAVTESQAASNIEQAKLDYEFAQLDLDKYLQGDYPQELMKAKNDITIAEQQQKRAADTLKWSADLKGKDFISEDEYEADRLSKVEKDLNLELARSKLDLLEKYTRERRVKELKSNVDQAKAALDRAERKANADVVQAKAELKSRDSELTRQKERLQKLEEQITNCRVTAPVDGMVVYATTGRQSRRSSTEPLAEGVEIRERQELIHLPVSTKMMAEIKIPESSLKKVKTGQRVRVTVDAHKGKVYWGHVGKIALLPDAASWWSNPDLKVYNSEIYIDGDAGDLRAGMSCEAEIIIARYEDALFVPIQSVVRISGKPVAFIVGADGPEHREVEIGLDNGRMVHVTGGLAEGEKVLLAPPLGESVAPIAGGEVPETETQTPTGAVPEPTVQPTTSEASPSPTPAIDREKLRSMSPEERRKFFENLTPEQREALRSRRPGGRRRPRQDEGDRPQRNTDAP